MALADSPLPLFQRGSWPEPVTLRRGWARAEARPWNDAVPAASLRIVRGGSGFLHACTDRLLSLGAPAILSPPLPRSATTPWGAAGYDAHLTFALMRLDLVDAPAAPSHLVVDAPPGSLDALLAIDRAAFDSFWRFDRHGLTEAIHAAGKTSILVIRDGEGDPVGYAVVGLGHAIAYLQRVAVHPRWQGHGMGRSLVRAAARRARARGARAVLLNTQFDNEPAITLYRAEGYVTLPEPLTVMRYG